MAALEVEIGKADFDFYAKFAKPLILTLNCTEDRILASAWLSKLTDAESGPEKLRLDYLKLLLFVLQRHRLTGPFAENPNLKDELENFGDNYDLATVAKEIIENEQQEKREKCVKKIRGEIGDFPPFSTDYSCDLREYVAAQDIPNFGVHVYYAVSKDPIFDWDNAHHAVFPKAFRRMEPLGHISETSFAILEPRAETPEEVDKCTILEETGVMPEFPTTQARRAKERKSPFQTVERLAPLLGVLPGEGEEEAIEEELPPPTWGSNLIEVREPLDEEGPETPPPETLEPLVEPEETPPRAASPFEEPAEPESPEFVVDTEYIRQLPTTPEWPPLDPDDPEIVNLLEMSFEMEDVMAEVDALEMEDDEEVEEVVDDEYIDIEAMLERQDALIAEAMADLDEDELRMLREMEEEEAAAKEAKLKKRSKKEVKVVADDDTVIKVLVEGPEAAKKTREEARRKKAKEDAAKKKKPAGRTGLNKGKAKGAILSASEKRQLEKEEKKAKVVATKTGVPSGGAPSKRPGVPKTKPTTSKSKVTGTASTGQIPSKTPSASGIPAPGRGIPRPAGTGIPRPGGTGIPGPGRTGIPRTGAKGPSSAAAPAAPPAEMEGASEELSAAYQERRQMEGMIERLNRMLAETKEAFPEKYEEEEQAGPSLVPEAAPLMAEEAPHILSPIEEISMAFPLSPGSPESDDIYSEMDREYKILERLYELYQKLSPDVPEELRTPPLFSKHPEIQALGRELKYRADEFDLHPMEAFGPASEYFRGREQPSPFRDPRELSRIGDRTPEMQIPQTPTGPPSISITEPSPPHVQAPPSPPPPAPPLPLEEETPPWARIEALKEITERADRRIDTSPAITAGVGVTTPKSPSSPKRLAKRDLRFEFDESPPPYESPRSPFSPARLGTPEFVRVQSYGFPGVPNEAELEQMLADKYPEYDAYIRAEIEAERGKWGVFTRPPPAPLPPPPPPPVEPIAGPSYEADPSSYVTPPRRIRTSRPPVSPPSVGRVSGTPEGVPPSLQFQYDTPPWIKPEALPPPVGAPVFEKFDPFEHEDVIYQMPPDLVEAELDEFHHPMESPKFELKEWYDPMKQMASQEPFDMGLEMPDEMMSPDLVPFEDPESPPREPTPPPSPVSPLMDLQERLRQHKIDAEFMDPRRRAQLSKTLTIGGHRRIRVARDSRPSALTKQTIREDRTGERFEEDEDRIMKEEDEHFINMTIEDPDRVEHLKRMIAETEARAMRALEEEEPPALIETEDMGDMRPSPPPSPFRSPTIRTPERPVRPVATPPPAPGRGQLLWQGSPEAYDRGMLMEGEIDFLASPGLPTPPAPSPPPRAPVSPGFPSPPAAPPRDFLMYESPPPRGAERFLDEDIDEGFLASPGLPQRRFEDELKDIGSPVVLPPPIWEQPPPAPAARARPSPPRPARPPSPPPRPVAPPGSPEIDAAAMKRELRRHRVAFPRAKRGGFRAARKWVPRRSAGDPTLVPIGERMTYDESRRAPREIRDYRHVMAKLPYAPPAAPEPYPSELMGEDRHGQFYQPDSLMDQHISLEEDLPSPIKPQWQVFGWETPPHLKSAALREQIQGPRRQPVDTYAKASHYRDPLLFEEPPEGLFLPSDDDVVPMEMMAEGLISPPRRPARSPPPMAMPSMSMEQQMTQAAQMAQWQAQQLTSSQRAASPPRAPSPPPKAPSPARAPHWSPEPGPSSVPHQYPYAPPSPPRQPSPPKRRSPDRLQLPSPGRTPCAPEPSPKVTKRMKEITFTSEFYDPENPDRSTKRTRGKTMLEFNRPEGPTQRPVQTPPSQGVAVYARGPPASAGEYDPADMQQVQMGTPERVPRQRRQRVMRGADQPYEEGRGGTPMRQGGGLPRRRITTGERGVVPRKRLFREFMEEPPQEPQSPPLQPMSSPPRQPASSPPRQPASRSPPGAVCPGARPGNERVQIVEEFDETEHDFIPEHLRGFRWIDQPEEDEYYQSFRQQFR